ncbi:MAG: DegT/DnrJ/EryC1/StrS family aminotransferase [Candidatus Binatia bacterium]
MKSEVKVPCETADNRSGVAEEHKAARQERIRLYRVALAGVEGFTLPFLQADSHHACSLFPIPLEDGIDREQFVNFLEKAGIETGFLCPAIHRFS